MDMSNRKEMDSDMLNHINEQLEEELLMHKKYINYSNQLFDNELKDICIYGSQKHKENYNNILKYLTNNEGS
ncbi:hypothetical protein GOQ29_13525 [Clostridium sp. D2Q-14]|uniref:hypothetical protein n=1 Tax=Anaeromonas gelatinilytica TaxID=2683194 RepID=UPI00193B88AE|nr:hypothetical protein [Anaeromonas gelatinilytica]MBS4536639.1 hypothetical protein [Anaeromonas gelatinilytica]